MLSWGVLIVGVLSPVVTVAIWFGGMRQRLIAIEKQISVCKTAREKEEKELHGRITDAAKDLTYLKGRFNGHTEKAKS